jgi:signal transduction histidine kinase
VECLKKNDSIFLLIILINSFQICCNSFDRKFKGGNFDELDSISNNFIETFEQNPETAEKSARYLIYQSSKLNYSKGKADGYARISYIHEQNGNYDSAVFYNLIALKIRLIINDTPSIAGSYINLARNYSKLRNLKSQDQYLSKALKISKASKDAQLLYFTHTQLGVYAINAGDLNSSKQHFAAALYFSKQLPNRNQLGTATENYANSLNNLNQRDSAILLYRQAISIYQSCQSIFSLAGVYNNLALVLEEKGQNDSAKYYLERGYELTKVYGNKQEIENYLLNLIDYWKSEPDSVKSIPYLLELVDLKDSIFNENLSNNVAAIEKDFTVKLQKEENEKLKADIRRKNTIRNAAIIFSLLIVILALFQIRAIKQKKNLAEKEKQLKESEIDELLKDRELKNMDALLEGRETERKRIGRDLHDRLGSILSTVKLHFSAIDEKIDLLKQENQIQYQKAAELLDEAVGEVRKISQDLVSGVLVKYGLFAAVNDLKNTLEATGKIKVNLFENGTDARQNLEFEIGIYRILQELVSNILKHANASKVDIHLTMAEDHFMLLVEDDGVGFAPENPENFGIGIANIRQRVLALGGTVSFDSKPGSGATVIVEINLDEKQDTI